MKPINFIDLKAQYKRYQDDILKETMEVYESAQFIGGEKLKHFEQEIASYVGCSHAIGCSSGTDALLLALMAHDIGAGDEVITTPFTFIATAEVIAFLGATPVFVDIEADTYNIDATKIEAAITPKTRAIIPVSLYGLCADMDTINTIAKKHDLSVIEDGCQSFGATYKGKKSGNLSDIGTTSFFPSKPLGCYGDGGALFTNDDASAEKLRMLLNHGQNVRYKHAYIGINGRLDALQAAILTVKLRHFDEELQLRAHVANRYNEAFQPLAIQTPLTQEGYSSVYAQYSIQVNERDAFIQKLQQRSIPTAVHYPIPLHLQKAFSSYGYSKGEFPVAEMCSEHIVSLPMSAFLSESDQIRIIESVKESL